jgi:hypothetical protein
MKIIEAGHIYELNSIDASNGIKNQTLIFVNREPGAEHPGTQTQEVLRALIDRTMHCDNCLRWSGNDEIIYHLRMALVLHEARALLRKTEKGIIQPENVNTNSADGHFSIVHHAFSDDSIQYDRKPKPDSPVVPKMPSFCKAKEE